MTRLASEHITSIQQRIPLLEQRYQEVVGKNMLEIGCYAAGVSERMLKERRRTKVACVPITAGEGIIGDFSETVARILRELADVDAFVTDEVDVAGIQEAYLKQVDILFLADDNVCFCKNLNTGALSDNGYATGRGFATLLYLGSRSCLSSEHVDEGVLVLGAGKVGVGAFRFLEEKGITPNWFDPNAALQHGLDLTLKDAKWSQKSWGSVIDATTAPSFIEASALSSDAIVAAPGIPFGLTEEGRAKARFVFDDELETGVMVMLCEGMRYGRK